MRQTITQQTLSSYTLTVTDVLLAGQTISAVDGCTVTINRVAVALPHTLAVGEVLAVTHGQDRTHPSGISLLAQVGTDAPAGALPDPDPAQWTYVDGFARTFLGNDYTTDLSGNQQAQIQGGGLNLGQAVAVASSSGDYARARLAAPRWNGPNVSVQYDGSYVYPQGPAPIRPSYGVRVVGPSKSLSWNGQRLGWGNVTLGTASGTAPATVGRTRLTVDTVAARIQVQLDGTGLIDVPLPADYVTQMAGQGLIELFHETNATSSNTSGTTSATFDNLAIRNGDGTASLGSGSPGTGVRYGSQWRLASGAPDDALGINGDIWLDTSSSALYQRVSGSYQAAGNIRGPQGLPGERGAAGRNEAGTARLSRTSSAVTPGCVPRPGGDGTPLTYQNAPYGPGFRLTFTNTMSFPLEGVLVEVDDISGGTLTGAYLEDAGGSGVNLGVPSIGVDPDSPSPRSLYARFPQAQNLPPGQYVLTLIFGPDTVITMQRGQLLLGGATSFQAVSVNGNFPAGARCTFLKGPGNVVGQLDASAMRVVAAPTMDPDWYDGCFEVVAASGAAPYLRTRHAGVNYKLALVPE